MPEFSLTDIYGYLTPIDILSSKNASKTETQSIDVLLRKMILETYVKYSDIKEQVETYYKKSDASDSDTHSISTDVNSEMKFSKGDKDKYWTVDSLIGMVPALAPIVGQQKKVSIFSTSNAFVSPAQRSTFDAEFFLNYIPSIFASQMVPFLDVEFKIDRAPVATGVGATNLTSPSLLRFMVGSTALNSTSLTDADRALDQTSVSGSIVTAYSGMEMFLAPQTLSNMDNLVGDGKTRLVDVKPFVPFASVVGMDVTVLNAGAGAMAHKKASLKLKIHDKSRLSEISTFLRGQVASATATVITTYGWLAPRSNGPDDVYAKFINEKMMIRERWMVANTSFSFDATGQVSVSLELVAAGANKSNQAFIEDDDMAKLMSDLSELVKRVADYKLLIPGGDQAPADVRTFQILNAGAVGSFPDIKDDQVKKDIAQLVKSLRDGKQSKMTPDQINGLESSLKKLYVTDGQSPSFKKKLEEGAKKSARIKLTSLSTGADPFLADDTRKEFFGQDLLAAVSEAKAFNKGLKSDNLPSTVASFGKVFTTFVSPALLSLDDCDEIQFYFYALNDSCGPVSGHSVAEFPVDLRVLNYAYGNALKGNSKMTVEAFLALVINTQFNDNRALAYGMQKAWQPFDPEKSEASKNDVNYESVMTNWHAKYGSLQRPAIEMYVEMGTPTGNVADTLRTLQASEKNINQPSPRAGMIKRIHVYDKTNTPYKLLSKIIAAGDGFTVGNIKSSDRLKTQASNLKVANIQELQADIDAGKLSITENSKYTTYSIKKDRKSVMEHVQRSAPNIVLGANGTLVIAASLASKADNLQSAANIINTNNAYKGGGALAGPSGLEDPNGLPLRTFPGQLTMTTLGCPIAQLYQQYFIDFKTGTTLDNLYNCIQLQHSLSPGKFNTNWTFVYTDAYGKFANPPSLVAAIKKLGDELFQPAVKASK